ncbi:expressed unknown protein [Seminavis robusta]|uniref:Uncharacterized protein n=1 Tax=Seminavis robusta TaxID=568900 RepID=A0A9N8HGA2_9STRA|nr:expressed unknown protein [Seminavis robusta]|eukprot:Sro389_g132500.1 n/a (175) ;mRNA; f:3706-4230
MRKRRVQFDHQGSEIHEVPSIAKEEKKNYWYTPQQLKGILVSAITSTGEAVKEARSKGGEMPDLRGLESLSKTSQERKEEISLDRLRVIQAYTKQKRQTGSVDEESIRSLYHSFTEEDTKRALAYGKIDAKESYSYTTANGKTTATTKQTSNNKGKGMLDFLFGKKSKGNKTHK